MATKKKAARASRPSFERPLIIDENDGPCEICAAKTNGVCGLCGRDKDLMCGVHSDNTKNVESGGFQSPRPSHYHLTPIDGINGRRAYWAELCYKCYQAEYKAVYGKDPFAQ